MRSPAFGAAGVATFVILRVEDTGAMKVIRGTDYFIGVVDPRREARQLERLTRLVPPGWVATRPVVTSTVRGRLGLRRGVRDTWLFAPPEH